jgi:hypothetical protein
MRFQKTSRMSIVKMKSKKKNSKKRMKKKWTLRVTLMLKASNKETTKTNISNTTLRTGTLICSRIKTTTQWIKTGKTP